MKSLGIIVLTIGLLVGCANVEKLKSYNSPHRVVQYSGGQVVNEWVSSGKVLSEESSDGYYFFTNDGRYVEASGTILIERLAN